MSQRVIFEPSRITYRNTTLWTGRVPGRDLILARSAGALPSLGLQGGERLGEYTAFPAHYDNMLVWERVLAPERRLVALNHSGHSCGFGAGNRMVVSWHDLSDLTDLNTFAGWDGILAGMLRSAVPFWFVQQSIVRELIPEGVDPADYPGIGHTGGYGPRELLRAGLFAYASQGGYARSTLPIGADADHAIIVGRDEEALAASLAFNKLAISESRDYTKFTVDTSNLFGFTMAIDAAGDRRLGDLLAGRRFVVPNTLSGHPAFVFEYSKDEITRLGRKYWRACAVHKEIYDHVLSVRVDKPFDYELSLDETPEAMPPRDLLFYLVLLESMGVPAGAVASAGPNLGFIKRHDYEGTLPDLRLQVNACASILEQRGAMLSVHSADGVRASTGKGPGVDAVIQEATDGRAELKVADVYQEVMWQVLASSEVRAEREIFVEAWRRTYEAARQLAVVYAREFAGGDALAAQRQLSSPAERERIAHAHGHDALRQTLGAIGYGLPVFRLAQDLLLATNPDQPDPDNELFRRFMFLTFRGLRARLFREMTRSGWERLRDALAWATVVRLQAMHWER